MKIMSEIQKSCLRYQGSKYELIRQYRIHEFIPITNVNHPYCEVFCGSAVMFFNIKTTAAYLNDIDRELTNFWVQVQKHKQELEDRLKYIWNGKGFIEDLEKEETTELNRAILFFLRNNLGTTEYTHLSFICKQFDIWTDKMNSARLLILNEDYENAMKFVANFSDPLQKRAINENRDLYAVFYEDPPYVASESVYKSKEFDHTRLFEINTLYAQKGHHIILSYNKCPEILELYKEWNIKEFKYNTHNHYGKDRIELLISNRKLKRYINKTLFD